MMTQKEAFRLVHSRARRLRRDRPHKGAYFLADLAIDELVYEEHDYRPLVEVQRAVLFAIHWRFEAPAADMPIWGSEAHIGCKFGPDGGAAWYEAPGSWIRISEANAGIESDPVNIKKIRTGA